MKRYLILLFLLIPAICFAGDWTIDLAAPGAIGGTTPAAGTFTPLKAKGPAAITTFAGTVSTSGSSTTITWSSAADAILAGYDATNPTLGATIITGAIKQASVTRYVVSWTNSTACVVDTACTLAAATELTSVQLPIAALVTSAGVKVGYIVANGTIRIGIADSSAFTDLLVNPAAKSSGNLMDLQVAGVSKCYVNQAGQLVVPDTVTAGTTNQLNYILGLSGAGPTGVGPNVNGMNLFGSGYWGAKQAVFAATVPRYVGAADYDTSLVMSITNNGTATPWATVTNTIANGVRIDLSGTVSFTGTPDVVSSAGAISIRTSITHVVTNGVGTVLTLAAGVEGQVKYIVLKTLTSGGQTDVVTPDGGGNGFTTITMAAAGQAVTLLYTNAKWTVVGSFGVVIA